MGLKWVCEKGWKIEEAMLARGKIPFSGGERSDFDELISREKLDDGGWVASYEPRLPVQKYNSDWSDNTVESPHYKSNV